jgi:RimJ/RimL family protein N-acetyltransferase
MFGNPFRIEIEGFGVTLRPLEKEDLSLFVEYFQHLDVVQWTNMTFAPTLQKEEDWWQKSGSDMDSVVWGIVPDGSDIVVGVTSLHGIQHQALSCTSGIIIGDKKWWGKGVASRAHLIRTWYAASQLNRYSIQTSVRAPNCASLKALQRVGYALTGKYLRNCYRNGSYYDTFVLTWINPRRAGELYPDQYSMPKYLRDPLKKAQEALEIAEQYIQIL